MRFAFVLLLTILLFTAACTKEQGIPVDQLPITEHKINSNQMDDNKIAIVGVISDIHEESERAERLAAMLKARGAEFILIPGDLANNEELLYGIPDSNDKQEIMQALEAVAKTNIPVLVIPGNHEEKEDYNQALEDLKESYPNIIDMNVYRVADMDDVDIVSLPGYQVWNSGSQRFIPDTGFYASSKKIGETSKYLQNRSDPVLFITHGPPKTFMGGPGTISSGEDVGDQKTTDLLQENNVPFAVFGHIHESGGVASTWDQKVDQKTWSETLLLNAGTLLDWRNNNGKTTQGIAFIITINQSQAMYEEIALQ